MSFDTIDEEWIHWRLDYNPEYQSIGIDNQYEEIQSLEYIKELPELIDYQPFDNLSEDEDLNSIFNESLLHLSKQSTSKDGTNENESSKDLNVKNERFDSIDMNKVVDEIISKRKTDEKNECKAKSWKLNNKSDLSVWKRNKCITDKKNNASSFYLKKNCKGDAPIYTRIKKISIPSVSKRTKRWGKDEDKIMFNLLLKACQEKEISLSDLSLEASLTNEKHYELLLNLKREMRWVGTTKQILQRILKSKIIL